MRREPTFERLGFDEGEDGRAPLARPRPFRRLRLAGRCVFAAALIAGLTVAARGRMAPAEEPRAWVEPRGPAPAMLARAAAPTGTTTPMLRLEPASTDVVSRSEPPRWSPASGLREDTLSEGGFDTIEAPFLRIVLGEIEAAAEPSQSFFVVLARRAAEMQGLSVLRTGLRGQVETKFGPFETVEATLSGAGARSCLGFRSLAARKMRIDGWLCGVLGQLPKPDAVACALDRLALTGPAAPIVEAAFDEAETLRRPGCRSDAVAGSPRRSADATGSIDGRKAGTPGRPRKK